MREILDRYGIMIVELSSDPNTASDNRFFTNRMEE